MKELIICEGPNELAIINMLLDNEKLIYTRDDLVNLTAFHARQIDKSTAVKTALNIYLGEFEVLRIGDKLSDKLRIPKQIEGRVTDIRKYCTKPELEMLLIISENIQSEFEKVKTNISPKTFSKQHIIYNRQKYDNSTYFYEMYYGDRINLLIESIKKYKSLKGKHDKDQLYLADLLR